jgi:hypothetical protein
VIFSKWKLWLIDARAFLVPVIFGCFWWIAECGHVLYNYKKGVDAKGVDEYLEKSWFWLQNKSKVTSCLANDITLMNSQPPWSWDDPPVEVFDVLGRIQTVFAFFIIICLIVVLIISRVLRLPMPVEDAVKMLGGVGVLKEVSRFGYRIVTGGWFIWYAIANVLGRRATTRDSTIKPISKLEKYFIKIHESFKQYNNNLVDVLRFDKHTKLFELYRKLALTEIGTHWIVIVVLAIMSVTTLINNKPKTFVPPEMTSNVCCKPDDTDADEGDTLPEEGLYREALKANAKWSLQTGIQFIKQLLFPIAYVLIGIATYSALMLLLLYTSNDWVEMTGKTLEVVVKYIWSGTLFAIIAVGIAMFIMNFLRYTEQLNSLLDYVVAHIFVVILAFCIITFAFA